MGFDAWPRQINTAAARQYGVGVCGLRKGETRIFAQISGLDFCEVCRLEKHNHESLGVNVSLFDAWPKQIQTAAARRYGVGVCRQRKHDHESLGDDESLFDAWPKQNQTAEARQHSVGVCRV